MFPTTVLKVQFSPKSYFRVLRLFGKIFGIWPASNNSKYSKLRVILWWLYVVNNSCILISSAFTFYVYKNDVYLASCAWSEMTVAAEIIVILVFTKYQERKFHFLLDHAEDQLPKKKQKVVGDYAKVYAVLYLFEIIGHFIVVVAFIAIDNPKSMYHDLFLVAYYPFDVDSTKLLKIFLRFHQLLFMTHSIAIKNLDAIVVLLIFTCTDRLKTLEQNFANAKNHKELSFCIREHAIILDLISKTNKILCFVVLKTVITFMSYAFGAGLQILNHSAKTQWISEIFILFSIYIKLYLYANSAQDMTSASEDIGFTVYFTAWYNENAKTVFAKTLIIQRCQKISVIRVNGIMTSFDKQYFGSILYATVSYFLTIRALTGSHF